MGQLKELSVEGVAATDEAVACTEAVSDGAWSGFRGYLLNTCNPNVAEGGASYGVWTAAAKGGTRLTAQLAGKPADATAVLIDTLSGAVYSTTSRTVYACYLAHEPVIINSRGMRWLNWPTADPHIAGQVWSNGGALTVSAG
jgi:hypothetical protein